MHPFVTHIEKLEEYLEECEYMEQAVSDVVDLFYDWQSEAEKEEPNQAVISSKIQPLRAQLQAILSGAEDRELYEMAHEALLELVQWYPLTVYEPINEVPIAEIPFNFRVAVSSGYIHDIRTLIYDHNNRVIDFPIQLLDSVAGRPFSYFDVTHIVAVARNNNLVFDNLQLPQCPIPAGDEPAPPPVERAAVAVVQEEERAAEAPYVPLAASPHPPALNKGGYYVDGGLLDDAQPSVGQVGRGVAASRLGFFFSSFFKPKYNQQVQREQAALEALADHYRDMRNLRP